RFIFICFFFQAEDGIRDFHVTGVQTCALPISYCSHTQRRDDRSGPPSILSSASAMSVCGTSPEPSGAGFAGSTHGRSYSGALSRSEERRVGKVGEVLRARRYVYR